MSVEKKVEGVFNKVFDITAGSFKLGRRVGKRAVKKF
jgi:hypothetical protein